MSEPTNPNVIRKHQDAIKEFNRLAAKTKIFAGNKVRVHGNDYCIAAAAHKYYMAPSTLRTVLFSCNY